MTNAISGMTGTVWIHTANTPASMVKLAELSDMKLKIDAKDIDTSNVDDAGWGSSIAGARSWEASLTNNLILADAAYILLRDALINGTSLYCYILQSGTATATPKGFQGFAGVSSGNFTLAGPSTQQKLDITLKGRGAMTVVP